MLEGRAAIHMTQRGWRNGAAFLKRLWDGGGNIWHGTPGQLQGYMNRGTAHRSREGIVSLIRSHLLEMLEKLHINRNGWMEKSCKVRNLMIIFIKEKYSCEHLSQNNFQTKDR